MLYHPRPSARLSTKRAVACVVLKASINKYQVFLGGTLVGDDDAGVHGSLEDGSTVGDHVIASTLWAVCNLGLHGGVGFAAGPLEHSCSCPSKAYLLLVSIRTNHG